MDWKHAYKRYLAAFRRLSLARELFADGTMFQNELAKTRREFFNASRDLDSAMETRFQ